MPGPANRKKKQNSGRSPGKASGGTLASGATACVDAIDNAGGWTGAVKAACNILKLPDLNTRSGLKKVHRDFASIYDTLDRLLKGNFNNDRVAGTVVAIYTKLCLDSILRNRLVHEKDILSKLMPLLDRDACRILVLQALRAITHHGGRETRLEIARRTPILIKMLEDFPNDEYLVDLVITIIEHSATAVVANEDPPDRKLLKAIDVPRLLQLLLFHLKRPNISSSTVDHALGFLAAATQHCSKDFFAFPSAVNLIIACTRCSDIQIRSNSISALLRLYMSIQEKEEYALDPHVMMANIRRGVPKHLNDPIISTCGPYESEMYRTVLASRDFMKAMTEYAQDRSRDIHKLALEIGRLIPLTEHSVLQGSFQHQNEKTGNLEVADVGLPFVSWVDALPLCAKDLRSKGTPDMLDMADIIDLKYMAMQKRSGAAQPMADRAIQRNPRVGFFYYIKTLGSDMKEGLRAAKKGSKCPNLTSYVKFAMLFRGIEHAMSMGLRSLENTSDGEQHWYEGVALLTCALEDANEFLRSAPPDNRAMKNVSCLQPLLALIVKGNEMGPDLTELKESTAKLKLAEQYAAFLGISVKKTEVRLSRDAIISQMAAASEEWDEYITQFHFDEDRKASNTHAPERAEEDLAAWLENVNLDEEEGVSAERSLAVVHVHNTHRKVNPKNVELYRCSWCRNPSAALRKCALCATVRYCDAQCQKEDWKTHKKACKQNT